MTEFQMLTVMIAFGSLVAAVIFIGILTLLKKKALVQMLW